MHPPTYPQPTTAQSTLAISNEQARTLIAAAQQAVSSGGDVLTGLRCQYPSKRCEQLRTTKRGGGLHRLCAFHRERANTNQWRVDQRRRARRDGSLTDHSSTNSSTSLTSSYKKTKTTSSSSSSVCAVDEDTTVNDARDTMDVGTNRAPLDAVDLEILHALLFNSEDEDER